MDDALDTPSPVGAELRVLLIEDNPGDARLIREMLVDGPVPRFHLDWADRFAAGAERIGEDGYDLLLLDLSLPDSSGLETFFRAHELAPTVPIVVLSGLDDETVAVRAVQSGAQDYLVKGRTDGRELSLAIRYAVERKRMEQERALLLESEQAARAEAERLAAERDAILQQITDGVITADPTGRVTFANPAAIRLLGLEGSGTPLDSILTAAQVRNSDGQPFAPEHFPLERAARTGESDVDSVLRIQQPGGAEVVVQAGATPILSEDGRRIGAVITMHDLTSRYELERQKDEFLSNVSHDLRTPVAAIKASIGVVLANEPSATPAPLHRMLANIDLASDEMARLVDDLLELTRLQAGRVQLWPSRVDLRGLALRAARSIEPLVHEREQRLELDLPTRQMNVVADGERIARVLLNLLSNAQKYGPVGGTIRLALESHPGEVIFSVSDEGPGIPPAEQERVFERFYRSETEATRFKVGSGLGLPIARALIELHGGRIWVESIPGHGATFKFALPTDPAHVGKDGKA